MEKHIRKSIQLVQQKYMVGVLALAEVYNRHNDKE